MHHAIGAIGLIFDQWTSMPAFTPIPPRVNVFCKPSRSQHGCDHECSIVHRRFLYAVAGEHVDVRSDPSMTWRNQPEPGPRFLRSRRFA